MLKRYWMKLKAKLTKLMGFKKDKKKEILDKILKLVYERREMHQDLEDLQLQMKDIKEAAEDVYKEIKEMENAMEVNEKNLLRLVENLDEESDIEYLYR